MTTIDSIPVQILETFLNSKQTPNSGDMFPWQKNSKFAV